MPVDGLEWYEATEEFLFGERQEPAAPRSTFRLVQSSSLATQNSTLTQRPARPPWPSSWQTKKQFLSPSLHQSNLCAGWMRKEV